MNMIPAQMQIPGLDMTANLHSVATEVLCLMNMVEVEELMDDEEYEGKSSTDVLNYLPTAMNGTTYALALIFSWTCHL